MKQTFYIKAYIDGTVSYWKHEVDWKGNNQATEEVSDFLSVFGQCSEVLQERFGREHCQAIQLIPHRIYRELCSKGTLSPNDFKPVPFPSNVSFSFFGKPKRG